MKRFLSVALIIASALAPELVSCQSSPAGTPAPAALNDIYIGAIHSAHTVISDGALAYPKGFYETFQPYWDWMATADHAENASTADALSLLRNSKEPNSPKFASMLGFEWSSPKWGHMASLYIGEPSTSQPMNWAINNSDGSLGTHSVTKRSRSGDIAVTVEKTNLRGASSWTSRTIWVAEGIDYSLMGWAQGRVEAGGAGRMVVTWFSATGERIKVDDSVLVNSDTWRQYTRSLTAPKGAIRCDLNIGIWGAPGKMTFDDLSITMISRSGYYNKESLRGMKDGAAWVEGFEGSGLGFDGIDNRMAVPEEDKLKPGGNGLTIALWAKPSAGYGRGQGEPRLVQRLSAGGRNSYGLYVDRKTGNAVFSLRLDDNDQILDSKSKLAPDKWTHIAATYDNNRMRVYFNGVETASGTEVRGAVNRGDAIEGLYIGGSPGAGFSGALDGVRLYGRALTPQEIAALARGQADNDRSLVAYYPMNEGRDGFVHDQSPLEGNLLDNPGFETMKVLAQSYVGQEDTPRKLYDFLKAVDGLACYGHPASASHPIHFSDVEAYRDDRMAPLVEIVNGGLHWDSTWIFADGRSVPNPVPPGGGADADGWVRNALDRHYRLGFVGGFDLHDINLLSLLYCYTGVVAGALTKEAIVAALRERHTYGVLSPYGIGRRILLKATADGHLMGDAFTARSANLPVSLAARTDLAPFTVVNLFVNGRVVESRNVTGMELSQTFTAQLVPGENYVFLEVRTRDALGRTSYAFASPFYVSLK